MIEREQSPPIAKQRENENFALATQAIKNAYERAAGKHPTTAEVMNAYDKLVGQQSTGGIVAKHSPEVVKILLAVARRNTDGRWLSNLYLYKKEVEHGDDSFCSQKTHKKSVRGVDNTRNISYQSNEEAGRDARSNSEKTKKESFFRRVSPSNSPDRDSKESPNEDESEDDQIEREDSPDGEQPQVNPVPMPHPEPVILSKNRLPTQSDMPSEILPVRLNTSKNKSELRNNLMIFEEQKERPTDPIEIEILDQRGQSIDPHKDTEEDGPTLLESAYVFYRMRLLSKSMYALQTSTAFAKRLTGYLAKRKQILTIESKVAVFFVLKHNLADVKKLAINESRADEFMRQKMFRESWMNWKLFCQLQKRERLIFNAIKQRSDKKLMHSTLVTMNAFAQEKNYLREKSLPVERMIAATRVSRMLVSTIKLMQEKRRESKSNQVLNWHLKSKSFHLLRAATERSKEIKRQEQLAEEMAVSQQKMNLFVKAFAGFQMNLEAIAQLEEVADLQFLRRLLLKGFRGFFLYKNSRRAEIPIYSDRQKFLGLKYFGLLGKQEDLAIPEKESQEEGLDSERIGWSLTSRPGQEDYQNRIGVTSVRNQIIDRLSTIVPLTTESINTKRLRQAIQSHDSQVLMAAFRSWRLRVLRVKDFVEMKDKARKQAAFEGFLDSVNKSILLKNNHQVIEGRKEVSLKEIFLYRWREILHLKKRNTTRVEEATQHYKRLRLEKLFGHWKTSFMKEMATERKVRYHERSIKHRTLARCMEAFVMHVCQQRKKHNFEKFVTSFYIRSLFAKSVIGLKNYSKYRKEKSDMKKKYGQAVELVSMRRPLHAMYHVLVKRTTIRNFVALLHSITKKRVLHRLHSIMKSQDKKVTMMKQFGKEKILLKSSFNSWVNQVRIQNWQREQIIKFREKSEFTNAKIHLFKWHLKWRVEKEARDRESAASDFYDIKILVGLI